MELPCISKMWIRNLKINATAASTLPINIISPFVCLPVNWMHFFHCILSHESQRENRNEQNGIKNTEHSSKDNGMSMNSMQSNFHGILNHGNGNNIMFTYECSFACLSVCLSVHLSDGSIHLYFYRNSLDQNFENKDDWILRELGTTKTQQSADNVLEYTIVGMHLEQFSLTISNRQYSSAATYI